MINEKGRTLGPASHGVVGPGNMIASTAESEMLKPERCLK